MPYRSVFQYYLIVFLVIVTVVCGRGQPAPAVLPLIDVHAHLTGATLKDYQEAAKAAVAAMDQYGIKKMIVMPPPGVGGLIGDDDVFLPAIQAYPTRFLFLGGGGRLNPMIQRASGQTTVSDELRRQFEQEAEEVLKHGAAGFGEIAIHHLSFGQGHPYESVAGDHPLLLLLADIAARRGVPLDIHFDVVTEDMAKPDFMTSPLNPSTFKANIDAFERLLAHNPKATIIWEHCGTDTLGCWTVDLTRRLLAKYPNLYIGLRIGLGPGHYPLNNPLMRNGQMKPNWLRLFQDYPTRFMMGSDRFVTPPGSQAPSAIAPGAMRPDMLNTGMRNFLNALPLELARKFAAENAEALYMIKE